MKECPLVLLVLHFRIKMHLGICSKITHSQLVEDICFKQYSKVLFPHQLECLKNYLLQCLYLHEAGFVKTGMKHKARSIRVEGLPDCGISYRHMYVNAVSPHPITLFLLDLVKMQFNMLANTMQISVLFPSDKDLTSNRYYFKTLT